VRLGRLADPERVRDPSDDDGVRAERDAPLAVTQRLFDVAVDSLQVAWPHLDLAGFEARVARVAAGECVVDQRLEALAQRPAGGWPRGERRGQRRQHVRVGRAAHDVAGAYRRLDVVGHLNSLPQPVQQRLALGLQDRLRLHPPGFGQVVGVAGVPFAGPLEQVVEHHEAADVLHAVVAEEPRQPHDGVLVPVTRAHRVDAGVVLGR